VGGRSASSAGREVAVEIRRRFGLAEEEDEDMELASDVGL
jgi:hypothetical protein